MVVLLRQLEFGMKTEQKSYWSGFGFTNGFVTAKYNLVEIALRQAERMHLPLQKGWYTGVDNLQISKSTTIENAKGGAKADTLIGNDARQ